MSLRIRLKRTGRKKRPYYHIVIADSKSPRDGKFIENVGTYDPLAEKEKKLTFKNDRIKYWFDQGAKPSDTVWKFLDQAELSKTKMPSKNNPKKALPRKKAVQRMKDKKQEEEDLAKNDSANKENDSTNKENEQQTPSN